MVEKNLSNKYSLEGASAPCGFLRLQILFLALVHSGLWLLFPHVDRSDNPGLLLLCIGRSDFCVHFLHLVRSIR